MNIKKITAMSAAAAAVFGALLFLWNKTQSVDVHAHEAFDARLRDLRSLDRTMSQDVLRVRFQLIQSYDAIASTKAAMDAMLERAAELPDYLGPDASAELAQRLQDYAATREEKAALIEQFKSHNSVLKNSLRYIPTLAERIVRESRAQNPDSLLAARVGSLLSDLLVYNLTADEEYAPRVVHALNTLLEERGRYPEAALAGSTLTMFGRHVETILREKPLVDGLIAKMFQLPMEERERQVAQAYAEGYALAVKNADAYRTFMYVLCVLLAGLVAVSFMRLRKAMGALAMANANLEHRVEARTAELSSRNRDMRLVLDNVADGFVTVLPNGTTLPERSAAAERWIGAYEPGKPIWESLAKIDRKKAEWMALGWESLVEGLMPRAVCLDQLPKHMISQDKRHFQLEYQPLDDSETPGPLLLVLRDVTAEAERQRAEAEHREMVAILQRATKDANAFRDFYHEASRLVSRALNPASTAAEAKRDIHTIKGNASIFCIESLVNTCHALEDKLAETGTPLDIQDKRRLSDAWHAFAQRVESLVGSLEGPSLDVDANDVERFLDAAAHGASRDELIEMVHAWRRERVERRLSLLGDQARSIAERLGKPAPDVQISADDIRVPRESWSEFWSACVHVIRNAVDHGIEAPEDRVAAGKPPKGRLRLQATKADGGIELRVVDDGRGIDWDAVKRAAEKQAIMGPRAAADPRRLIFADGLSTKDEVSTVSGRGVGMGAVLDACKTLGGEVDLETHAGAGTAVVFHFPEDALWSTHVN
jgi:two-component system chemotaxis sensor kinase CheA